MRHARRRNNKAAMHWISWPRVIPMARPSAAAATAAAAGLAISVWQSFVWYEQCDENCYSSRIKKRKMLKWKYKLRTKGCYNFKVEHKVKPRATLFFTLPPSLSSRRCRRSRSNARALHPPLLPVCEYTHTRLWMVGVCYYCFCSLLALFFRSSAVSFLLFWNSLRFMLRSTLFMRVASFRLIYACVCEFVHVLSLFRSLWLNVHWTQLGWLVSFFFFSLSCLLTSFYALMTLASF